MLSFPPKTETQPGLPSLAITSCDSYEGQRLALQLATHLENHHHSAHSEDHDGNAPLDLVCLARNPDKCALLQNRANVKVVKFSYEDQSSLSVAIRGITTVVLVPEIEPQRLDWANMMVDTFKQEQVVRCIVISCIGTDAPEKRQLDAFRRTEEKVSSTIQRWTVLREGFPFQALFYWIPMIQDQGTLGMSIKPEVVYAPLDIIDLGHALISVIFPEEHDNAAKHDGQVYTLTGPETVTGPKLADGLNRALGPDKGRDPKNASPLYKYPPDAPTPIVYKELAKDEVRQYLVSLRDKKPPHTLEDTVFLDKVEAERADVVGATTGILTEPSSSTILGRAFEFWQKISGGRSGKNHGLEFTSVNNLETEGRRDEIEGMKDPDDPCKDPSCGKDPKKPKESGPELEAPNDTEVDLVVELLEYMHEGRATFQSGDLKKITGIDGVNASVFFEKNARNFRKGHRLTLTSASTSVVGDVFAAMTLRE
ncbi:hypothetical protein BGZ83_006078 [Gryganskiella cystojenkinii]|nr:hypothetical protein BGZ83_006078 [Gryganskiella cystojenkinii]